MPFNLTDHDSNLLNNMKITVVASPINGFNFMGGEIPIQFPPHITSDGKTLNWTYKNFTHAWEPLVTGYNASARKISMKLSYVATGHTSNGVEWTPLNISNIVKDIRAYFSSTLAFGGNLTFPFFQVSFIDHLPADTSAGPVTLRGISVSESPGDSYITHNGHSYAFSTDVNLTLEVVTNIQKDTGAYLDVSKWPDNLPARWY